METEEENLQIQGVLGALSSILGGAVHAVYLHGSAVSGGLQPQSDIDLLVITSRPMSLWERQELLYRLLILSGPHPRKAKQPRCLELLVFAGTNDLMQSYPAQADFVYGEWLRPELAAGAVPGVVSDPENTLLLAQVRRESVSLMGPQASSLLPDIPRETIRLAIGDALPMLLNGLPGDERNVLLTLARMWRTAQIGDFASKADAADWAVPKMPIMEADTLDYARRAYLGEIVDAWNDKQDAAHAAAEFLRDRVLECLETSFDQ